jgi:lipopolysaccharide transport system ATP-binding protein
MSRPIIEVTGLGKKYRLGVVGATTLREDLSRAWRRLRNEDRETQPGEFWALHDVSFSVNAGDVVGIIGRNGAGKSTLLKLLSRITEPTRGRAVLRGRVASLLEVGTGFHGELTGRENVFLNGAILGLKRNEVASRFDEIVAFAEIGEFIDTPVKHYSSGMYVRLAFAVAAHLDPEILVIDEVLAVGDAAFQKKCLGKIGRVAAEGRTVLFVSHNATAVRTLCSHALLLEHGRARAYDTVGSVLDLYFQSENPRDERFDWPDPAEAPGNELVRLRSVRIVRPLSGPAVLNVHSPFEIEIAYWNRADGMMQNVSLVLSTVGGSCVLNTYSPSVVTPAGLVIARCQMPGDFLNDESYQVELLIVKDAATVIFRHEEPLTFSIAEGTRQGAWHGKHSGVVRPRLTWEVQAEGRSLPS